MSKLKVAAYIRICSGSEDYKKRQIARWEKEIASHADWEFAGVYVETGSPKSRWELGRLVEDCKQRKVDLIVTPTVTRFGRGLPDAMNTVRGLYLEPHSVGVLFEKENLDTTGDGNIPALLKMHEMVIAQSRPHKTAYAAATA
jgi:DNA invertase Pin-like site-specific DNA recombinase